MGSGIRENSFLPQGQDGILQKRQNQPTPPGAPGGSLLVCTHSVACCGYSARQTFRNQNEEMDEKRRKVSIW